jgi:hypothetical protein
VASATVDHVVANGEDFTSGRGNHHMRGTKIGIITLAAAGLLLAGCSSGSGDDTTTPSASRDSSSTPEDSSSPESSDGGGEASGDLVAWAGDLCGAIRPLEEKFDGFSSFAPTDPADPAAVIDQLRATFSGIGPVFDDAHDAVDDAGPPPVDGGDETYNNMLTVLSTAADAFDQIDQQLADIDPTDPAALESLTPIFTGIGEQLQDAGDQLDQAFGTAEMKDAFAASPDCEGLNMTSS